LALIRDAGEVSNLPVVYSRVGADTFEHTHRAVGKPHLDTLQRIARELLTAE
jgi:hypothetical protein